MFSRHAQAILLTSAAALFALFAVGLGAMLLTSAGLADPSAIAELGEPMRVALAAFGAVFVAAALHFVLGGRRQAR
ncbi:hypothetical protein [Citreimonas salinaria]|uniref:Uncharacterized protein n=1 Tax=Citreimonas salinaria TaxID=321339 RepID=A0A1H3P0Z2_9RHOB|nr:hypothetical protein [Citreimonas salinaria]SDY94710.1 hypothetical protein SAMN05444340_1413 [Citreimonas salinaria]